MMQSVMLLVHVAVCLMIVALVLLQRGKGADAGTGFGAGASGTVFGSRGSANFLSRATAGLATAFFVTSLSLAYLGTQRAPEESLLERAGAGQAVEQQPQALPPADSFEEPPAMPADQQPAVELPGSGSDSAPQGAGESN